MKLGENDMSKTERGEERGAQILCSVVEHEEKSILD
jgi:hypothetical protein